MLASRLIALAAMEKGIDVPEGPRPAGLLGGSAQSHVRIGCDIYLPNGFPPGKRRKRSELLFAELLSRTRGGGPLPSPMKRTVAPSCSPLPIRLSPRVSLLAAATLAARDDGVSEKTRENWWWWDGTAIREEHRTLRCFNVKRLCGRG